MPRNSTILLVLATLVGLVLYARGPVGTTETPEPEPVVTMSVQSCSDGVGPGAWLLLACTFEIPEGWHIYWKNPGESGAATSIRVQAPPGFVVKPVVFPRPQVFPGSAGVTYGYEKKVTLLVPIYPPPAGLPGGEGDESRAIPLTVSADWLVCREKCFIGQAKESIEVRWHDQMQPLLPWARKMLAEPQWPRPLAERPQTTSRIEGSLLVIEGPRTRSGEMGFLPDPTPGVDMGTPRSRIEDGRFRMEVPFTFRPQDTLGQAPLARGLLIFGEKATMPAYDVSVPVTSNGTTPGRGS
ncbi:MAG: hypothetical protein MK116_10965 [Phycisphaerales bacterium]|nr:hypothetical protein [Phycisphaerales bacterium]